ncbi:mechanosensitive ion channel family protein [bacterium]|nr:mechanosensitive ion channel family protein [bacterium]
MRKFVAWLPNLISAIVILGGFYLLWQAIRISSEAVFKKTKLDTTAASFILTVLKYAIVSIGVISALGKIGVNTISILTSLGVAGLTLGFAAKDALSNMISGVFIFWDRPFVIGDLVEIENHYGRVERITMRSTRVITPDGRMLAVPNNIIINSTVASYTNFPHLRLDIPFTIGVNEDIVRTRNIALRVCSEIEELIDEPKPEVSVTELNDYNIGLRLSAWLENERLHIQVRDKLREILFEALREAKIDMPFETLSINPIRLESGA